MIRIVVVRVHNLGQSEIGDLDVATDGASSQQNVSFKKSQYKLVINRNNLVNAWVKVTQINYISRNQLQNTATGC